MWYFFIGFSSQISEIILVWKRLGEKDYWPEIPPQNNQFFLCILISLLKCFYIYYNIWTLNINKLQSPGIHIYVMFCQALGITENRLSLKSYFLSWGTSSLKLRLCRARYLWWIRNSTHHRKVWTTKLLHTM